MDLVGGQFSGRMGLGAGGGAHRLQTAQSMGHPTSFSRIGVGRRSEWNDFASGSRTVKTNAAIILIAVVMALSLCGTATAQVTPQRLLESSKEPQNWLTYSGGYCGASVQRARSNQHFECVFARSQMGLSDDGRREIRSHATCCGRSSVRYRTRRPCLRTGCAFGPPNLAVSAGSSGGHSAVLRASQSRTCHPRRQSVRGTLDAHVIALDSKTGSVVWDANAAEHAKGYSFTLAPLVIKNLVLVGVSGGEYGIRGFIDA